MKQILNKNRGTIENKHSENNKELLEIKTMIAERKKSIEELEGKS